MKNLFLGIIGLTLVVSGTAFAQGMPARSEVEGMDNATISSDGHTARAEAAGKDIWEKLQAEELKCENLTDGNFGSLGEYFMGQRAEEQHEAMNNMMVQMMGEESEEQMHVAMGKRMSGCEPNAPIPQNMMNNGMMPIMMNMMMGGWSNLSAPLGSFGWIFMVLWWVLIIAGIVALIKWLTSQSRSTPDHEKLPLEILKERYAKGEIDKDEFEKIKKDLSS